MSDFLSFKGSKLLLFVSNEAPWSRSFLAFSPISKEGRIYLFTGGLSSFEEVLTCFAHEFGHFLLWLQDPMSCIQAEDSAEQTFIKECLAWALANLLVRAFGYRLNQFILEKTLSHYLNTALMIAWLRKGSTGNDKE